jgi:hypothetical protein
MEKSAHAGPGGSAMDPYPYIELPVLDSPGTLALARALIERATEVGPSPGERPGKPSALSMAEVQHALRRLVSAQSDLTAASKRPDPVSRPELRQPADLAADTAWTALYERLRAYAMLPSERIPEARQAQDLLRTLFPDALAFLRLPYEAQWAEGDSRLRTIEQLRLAADLQRLAGGEFLAEVQRTHEIYGRVLGLGRHRDSRPPLREGPRGMAELDDDAPLDSTTKRELRFALSRAIAQYALKIVALSDEEDALVHELLAPLQELQALRRSGR